MEETLTTLNDTETSADEVANYKRAIAEMFAEMSRLNEHIYRSQAETARLRVETREILERLKAA